MPALPVNAGSNNKGPKARPLGVEAMTNKTIDINTDAGKVAGRLIISNNTLFDLFVAAYGGVADCAGYVFSTQPARPLKGRGNCRHIFDIEQSESAKRFYDDLPPTHKDEISERHNSKRFEWKRIISAEAKEIWDIFHDTF